MKSIVAAALMAAMVAGPAVAKSKSPLHHRTHKRSELARTAEPSKTNASKTHKKTTSSQTSSKTKSATE